MGKLCSSQSTVGVVPALVPVVPTVPAEAPAVPVADTRLTAEVPKCAETASKAVAAAHLQLLLIGSVPKIAVCKLASAKE